MFYNCPVRKLASHSPPSCEKKQHTNTRSHWHRYSHSLMQKHTLNGTDSHSLAYTESQVWTHADGDTPAETCRLHKLLLVPCSLGEHGQLGEEAEQYCLSELVQSSEICTPWPAKCGRPQLWHVSSSSAMRLALGCSLPLVGTRPQVLLLSVFTAGQLAPHCPGRVTSRSRSLKVAF